jgi:hypothetical protein
MIQVIIMQSIQCPNSDSCALASTLPTLCFEFATKQSLCKPSPLFSTGLLAFGESALASSTTHGLELAELLLRIRAGLGVVHELIHERSLATRAFLRGVRCKRRACLDNSANLSLSSRSAQGGREDEEPRTHSKVFGQTFDALAFAFVFPVEAFGVELIT